MGKHKQTAMGPEIATGTPEADGPEMLGGTPQPGEPEAPGSGSEVRYLDEIIAWEGAEELRAELIRRVDLLEPAQLWAVEQYLERPGGPRENPPDGAAPEQSGNQSE